MKQGVDDDLPKFDNRSPSVTQDKEICQVIMI